MFTGIVFADHTDESNRQRHAALGRGFQVSRVAIERAVGAAGSALEPRHGRRALLAAFESTEIAHFSVYRTLLVLPHAGSPRI